MTAAAQSAAGTSRLAAQRTASAPLRRVARPQAGNQNPVAAEPPPSRTARTPPVRGSVSRHRFATGPEGIRFENGHGAHRRGRFGGAAEDLGEPPRHEPAEVPQPTAEYWFDQNLSLAWFPVLPPTGSNNSHRHIMAWLERTCHSWRGRLRVARHAPPRSFSWPARRGARAYTAGVRQVDADHRATPVKRRRRSRSEERRRAARVGGSTPLAGLP